MQPRQGGANFEDGDAIAKPSQSSASQQEILKQQSVKQRNSIGECACSPDLCLQCYSAARWLPKYSVRPGDVTDRLDGINTSQRSESFEDASHC